MKFTWDPVKNRSNKVDHGITFEEAQVLFESGEDDVLSYPDDDHSDEENRSVAIGPIAPHGIILVVFIERAEDTIRLISARRATRVEAVRYHSYVEGKTP